MTKIAILADIHGNQTAFEAVLADAKSLGVEEYWFLGDLCGPGPGGEEMVAQLRQLNVTVCVRGNWDEWENRETVASEPLDLSSARSVHLYRLNQYFLENLSEESLTWLRSLPLTQKIERNGLRFQISHNLPDKHYGPELTVPAPRSEMNKLFPDKEADVAIFAHIHHQMLRYDQYGRQILNPGSIGQPFYEWEEISIDLRAHYLVLTLSEAEIDQIQFRKVAYDVEDEIALAKKKGLPYLELYERLVREGYTYTHDEKRLAAYNQQYGYADEVKTYFASSS